MLQTGYSRVGHAGNGCLSTAERVSSHRAEEITFFTVEAASGATICTADINKNHVNKFSNFCAECTSRQALNSAN
jgi:hypothetical protein